MRFFLPIENKLPVIFQCGKQTVRFCICIIHNSKNTNIIQLSTKSNHANPILNCANVHRTSIPHWAEVLIEKHFSLKKIRPFNLRTVLHLVSLLLLKSYMYPELSAYLSSLTSRTMLKPLKKVMRNNA